MHCTAVVADNDPLLQRISVHSVHVHSLHGEARALIKMNKQHTKQAVKVRTCTLAAVVPCVTLVLPP